MPGSPATVYNPSGQPHTMQEDGPGSDPVDTYDATRRDDVMDMPPPTGVLSPDEVSASNGDAGMGPLKVGAVLDTMRPAVQAPLNTATTPVRLNQQLNGLPQGQVPTSAAQQALNEQQHAQQLARQNEITREKQPGGGETTQTYRDAQQKIQTQMEQRRAHPLHQATWNADADRTNEGGTPTWNETGAFWLKPDEWQDWADAQWDKPEGSDIFKMIPEHTINQPHNMVAYEYRPGIMEGWRDERWPEGSERMPSEMDVKTNVVRPPFDIKDDDEHLLDDGNAMNKQWHPGDAPHPLHHEAASADDFYNELYGAPAGSNEDEWHRFSVLPHPHQPEDTNDIGISVRQLPDEPEPYEWTRPFEYRPGVMRQRFDFAVHHNGEPVIEPTAFWGRRSSIDGRPSSYQQNTHEDIARGVANALGVDGMAKHIDLMGTPNHPLSTPNYPPYNGFMGTPKYDEQGIPTVKDKPYTPVQKDFIRQYSDRLRSAGRDYLQDFDDPSESTLVSYPEGKPSLGERPVNMRQINYREWEPWPHEARVAGGLASAQQAVRD